MLFSYDREQAMFLLREHIQNENLINHCIASEAILRALAERFGEDVDKWGYAGLIHDLDYEMTADGSEKHGLVTMRMLREMDCPEDLVHAVGAHDADNSGVPRESWLDYALTCGEAITGLIVACALVYPDRKISSVKPKSIRKRMKVKAFARSVNRDDVLLCEKIDLSLDEFIAISLKAMTGISQQLGL